MNLKQFSVLSFDCYGTLIDWEQGIWDALQPLLNSAQAGISRERALKDFAETEPEIEHRNPTLLYRDILTRVHHRLASTWQVRTTKALDEAFGASIGNWPPFPDTAPALLTLARHYRLVILSNVDRQSFAATNVKLGITFDAICTAEDIGSYKPDLRNFQYLLETIRQMGLGPQQLLHVAQSLYHDIEPAEKLNISRCWINRRGDSGKGTGATKHVTRAPTLNFQFPSLAALVRAVEETG